MYRPTFADMRDKTLGSIREFCELSTPILMFDKNGDYLVQNLEEVSKPDLWPWGHHGVSPPAYTGFSYSFCRFRSAQRHYHRLAAQGCLHRI